MVHSHILSDFTERQQEYAGYLLERLGHEKGKATDEYLGVLKDRAYQYKSAGHRMNIPEDKQEYYTLTEDGVWVSNDYSMVSYLHDEVNIKYYKKYNLKSNLKGYITATDLANYVFCPIGFSIGRTIEGIKLLSGETGTRFHNLNILPNWSRHLTQGESSNTSKSEDLIEDKNRFFFDDIKKSVLTYSGHQDNSKKYFVNKDKNFVGQPDYVFKNRLGENYIVEEKFIQERTGRSDVFYKNHKIQLLSYIAYLKELNASYGYLVYWRYENDYGDKSIVDCSVLKIELNEVTSAWIDNVLSAVDRFRESGSHSVEVEYLNPRKCGTCVHSMHCGHKNQKYGSVSYPYSKEYHKLKYVEFPKALKK